MIPYTTVVNFLKRITERGVSAIINNRFRRKPKIIGSKELETLLLSETYLKRWIALPMAVRVEKIYK